VCVCVCVCVRVWDITLFLSVPLHSLLELYTPKTSQAPRASSVAHTHQVEQEVREVQLTAAGHWSVAPGVDTGTLASQLPAGVPVLHAAGDSGPLLASLEGMQVPDDLQYPQPP